VISDLAKIEKTKYHIKSNSLTRPHFAEKVNTKKGCHRPTPPIARWALKHGFWVCDGAILVSHSNPKRHVRKAHLRKWLAKESQIVECFARRSSRPVGARSVYARNLW
jgi:hypothetical protein